MRIDISAVAARLLPSARELVPQWIPGGKFQGHEYICAGIQGGKGRSFSVNCNTGAFAEFSGGDPKGGDLVALYAAIHGLSQLDAARKLEGEDIQSRPPNRPNAEPPPSKDYPALPAPIDYPPPPEPPSKDWGTIVAHWPYYLDATQGPVLLAVRFGEDRIQNGAKVRPLTWRNGRWRWMQYPDPRPLYRLPELLAAPDRPVLLVEGEKCTDAAQAALGDSYCVTTWSGGCGAHGKTNFAPLSGRDVTIWPDADPDGVGLKNALLIAGKLKPIAASVSVLKIPAEYTDGWDCVNALADGIDLAAFIHEHDAPITSNTPPSDADTRRLFGLIEHHAETKPAPASLRARADGKQIDESGHSQWERLALARPDGGVPFATEDNVMRIITAHDNYRDRLYFDTFRMRKILVLDDGTEREWTDADTLETLIWIQSKLYMPKMKKGPVRDGVDAAAARNQKNSLTAWLRTLEWDGIERLPTFMRDVFHAEDTQYSSDVGRCWLVSMMARAFQPGCQVDTMPVFEGGQGTYKSSALSILGGKYYAALPAAFGTRDFLQALDGMWLVEIPDMSGFKGRDIDHVKAIITTRIDRYCRRYAHDAETYPRQCVFAATANRDDWNEDETGARRFLPIRVGSHVELELLKQIREQLFAEALARYDRGEKWWDIEQTQAKVEQAARRPDDSWEPDVRAALENIRVKADPAQKAFVTVSQIFHELGLRLTDQGKAEQMRMARILLALGWIRQTYWADGKAHKRWCAPSNLTTTYHHSGEGGNDLID